MSRRKETLEDIDRDLYLYLRYFCPLLICEPATRTFYDLDIKQIDLHVFWYWFYNRYKACNMDISSGLIPRDHVREIFHKVVSEERNDRE